VRWRRSLRKHPTPRGQVAIANDYSLYYPFLREQSTDLGLVKCLKYPLHDKLNIRAAAILPIVDLADRDRNKRKPAVAPQ
jgi:hypothetical protein